ncbi:hypothetical protein A3G48_02320 [Candidatus Nomurabacteria bacterium RIFCSPLOWO2_12_FULL_40_42]|uniref:Uncharacterized protein n=1 Tax=Candidatus Nomurabacteria bacterium RIFCSPLOWO2_02_FULL_40_67 TaxID=1801787 RepID=A0A1F6Y3P6_9BACT|nr:MAG: hypothetical protein A2W12_00440 [Candidatus Nomurabacteria bacterium RBG_16_40_11]OGI72860.1 MAG: hypothetical protein A2W56_02020 [Candidatus Nomurabacteria bacterium RIFCSPHIGHO2_02_41_18]OGI78298.1 MAG: hypothetical protein A3C65_01405 [Candidatus Nomurabacteria bacterium RIFCSPHIGHO2_02_FULL_41_150]OGI81202.1 MAG: hypothetical protein A3E03_00690 [Candidatus Nomurabacteria bacterium RIFCSPHIGHO2_12_FULL_40_64]OGI90819.1 MAG: hypothetical protein A3A06_00070 [Candidatus Nomurabacter
MRSNAHAVSPVFANEFWVRKGAPPSAVRTVFSPRSRFEPKISLATTFFAKRSVSNAILSNPCATFTQFWKGSSQAFCLCEREIISSSSDFLENNNFDFSARYISFSISWSRYPVRSRSSLILIFCIFSSFSFTPAVKNWAEFLWSSNAMRFNSSAQSLGKETF